MMHVIANGGLTFPPLFKKAIALSPYLPPQYDYDDDIPEANFAAVVSHVGCSSATDQVECLRTKDLNTLIAANVAIAQDAPYGTFTWQPVTDKVFIRTLPSRALIRGLPVNGEKIIATHDAADGLIFALPGISTEAQTKDFLAQLYPKASSALLDAILALYPPSEFPSEFERAWTIVQDPEFVCPGYWLTQAYAPGKAWKGTWAIPNAVHGSEMPYIYGSPSGIVSESSFENFVGELANFIRTGDPNAIRRNAATNPEWKSFNSVVLGAWEKVFTTDGAMVSNPTTGHTDVNQIVRCLSWQGIGSLIGI
jgi:carboxylesterase type B